MLDGMDAPGDSCLLCDPAAADARFQRGRLWEDDLWRLSAVLQGPIPGFAHLEPRRHIPFITDLDGAEADTLGPVLARVTGALRLAAGAEKIYVYVFGDHTEHLHFNLAPPQWLHAAVADPTVRTAPTPASAVDPPRQGAARAFRTAAATASCAARSASVAPESSRPGPPRRASPAR